ncbi:MAG: hypothetical protein V3R30_11750, partial [Kiloniellales bacterium]
MRVRQSWWHLPQLRASGNATGWFYPRFIDLDVAVQITKIEVVHFGDAKVIEHDGGCRKSDRALRHKNLKLTEGALES